MAAFKMFFFLPDEGRKKKMSFFRLNPGFNLLVLHGCTVVVGVPGPVCTV